MRFWNFREELSVEDGMFNQTELYSQRVTENPWSTHGREKKDFALCSKITLASIVTCSNMVVKRSC